MANHLKSLRTASLENARVFVQTMITLASASLGLVAALAWNEAIKATIKAVFKTEDSLAGLYTYAILTTVLSIGVLTALAKLAAKIGAQTAINREAEG
jgi:hypothetical protein